MSLTNSARLMKKMTEHIFSSEELRIAEQCTKCMYCIGRSTEMCPSRKYFPSRAFSPPGRLDLARAYAMGSVEINGSFDLGALAERFFSCSLCGACSSTCERITGKRTLDVLRKMRVELVRRSSAPPPAHVRMLEKILKYSSPQGVPMASKGLRVAQAAAATGVVSKASRLLLYIGCLYSLSENLTNNVMNMLRVLRVAGLKVQVLPNEPCCGHVAINTGQEEAIRDYAEKVFKTVSLTGANQVLFPCPACRKAFMDEYPRLLGVKPNFECISSVELLARLADEGKLVLGSRGNRGVKTIVTYHDPCHLGRHMHLFDEPRRILNAIANVELVEMPRNRADAWCCGGGGGVKIAYPEFAMSTGWDRLREAQETGADTLVSACPMCESSLTDAERMLPELGGKSRLHITDITDVVADFIYARS